MNPVEALKMMRSSLNDFLKISSVTIEGTNQESKKTDYVLVKLGEEAGSRPGKILGNLNKHAVEAFAFSSQDIRGTDPVTVKVHLIGTQEQAKKEPDFNNLEAYLCPRKDDADVMITGQLTGCTFCCLETPEGMAVAHLQPKKGGADALREACEQGAFQGLRGDLVVYGPGNGYNPATENVSIIGVRKSKKWSIYAQVHPGRGRTLTRVDPVWVK